MTPIAAARVGALSTAQPQPPNSCSMPSRMERSLSRHSTVTPESRPRSGMRAACGGAPRGTGLGRRVGGRPPRAGRGKGQLQRNPRPAPPRGGEREPVIEHARDPLHDRKSKPEAAGDLGATVEPMKLLKNGLLLRSRNPKPGIMNLDAKASFAAAAADQHAARDGVFDGVRYEILKKPQQQAPIGAHREGARHEAPPEAFFP